MIETLFFSRMIGNYNIENLLSGMLMSGSSLNTSYNCQPAPNNTMNSMVNGCGGMNMNGNLNMQPTLGGQLNSMGNIQFNGGVGGVNGMNTMNGMNGINSFGNNLNSIPSSLNGQMNGGMSSMINTASLQFSPNFTGINGMAYNFGGSNPLNGSLGSIGNPGSMSGSSGVSSRSPSSAGSDGEHGHGSPSRGGLPLKMQNGSPGR